MRSTLDASCNEVYLWHGTSPGAVAGIKAAGFRTELAGRRRAATLFGDGIYFAECSSKADEYAKPEKDGTYAGCCALLLCRVVLGRPCVLLDADRGAVDAALRTGCHSVIGDRERARGTYREFVVFDNAQAYPEYIVLYTREY